jgi:hypothetical protein
MSTSTLAPPSDLSDNELLGEVTRLVARERHATAALIASLAEVDARRLYLGQGFSSLFTYCTQALHLSEHAAYGRIEAARAARRFPVILDLLTDGSVNLTTIGLLAPHLTDANHQQTLASARHKSKLDVEQLLARLRPQPDVPPTVRKVPVPKPSDPGGKLASSDPTPQPPYDGVPSDRPAVLKPLAPERYKVQFTVSRETYEKLRRVQDLMRHTVPNGDPAVIFDRALTELLALLEKNKLAVTARPRTAREPARQSRHIPASVKRDVWRRDAGRCAFVGTQGRCNETGFLEFHHVQPFADGGETIVSNLELRCRAHNAYEAERHFGSLFVREDRVAWEEGLGPDRVLRLARTGLWAS